MSLVIRRYNRLQFLKAVLFTVGGLVCCTLAYLFFRHLPAFVASQFGHALPDAAAGALGCLGLLGAGYSGYKAWQAGGSRFSYHESSLYHDFGEATAGAYVVDFYAHRITGPAYVISQLFMSGPLWLLRAWTLLGSRIPDTAELESRLESVLATLRVANKWQGLEEHPDSRTEILYLAQMGLIDFSAHKGTPRFKIR